MSARRVCFCHGAGDRLPDARATTHCGVCATGQRWTKRWRRANMSQATSGRPAMCCASQRHRRPMGERLNAAMAAAPCPPLWYGEPGKASWHQLQIHTSEVSRREKGHRRAHPPSTLGEQRSATANSREKATSSWMAAFASLADAVVPIRADDENELLRGVGNFRHESDERCA